MSSSVWPALLLVPMPIPFFPLGSRSALLIVTLSALFATAHVVLRHRQAQSRFVVRSSMRSRLALIGGLVLIAIFLVTLVATVLDRAEGSSGFPAYSSLNNGEEGLKAYYDALGRLGFETRRNFLPLHKIAGVQADIIYAGPTLQSFEYASNADLELFEQLANKGGRPILLLSSEGLISRVTPKKPASVPKYDGKGLKPPDPTLKRRWGIQVAYRELPREGNRFGPLLNRLDVVPATWHFSSWTNDWIPSHMRDYSPLFLERRFGKGSVLLVANARLFTNRELLLKPDEQLLAALPGPHRQHHFRREPSWDRKYGLGSWTCRGSSPAVAVAWIPDTRHDLRLAKFVQLCAAAPTARRWCGAGPGCGIRTYQPASAEYSGTLNFVGRSRRMESQPFRSEPQ